MFGAGSAIHGPGVGINSLHRGISVECSQLDAQPGAIAKDGEALDVVSGSFDIVRATCQILFAESAMGGVRVASRLHVLGRSSGSILRSGVGSALGGV